MTSDGTLVIRNPEREDGGVYGCLASNEAGTDTVTSVLTYIGERWSYTRLFLRPSHAQNHEGAIWNPTWFFRVMPYKNHFWFSLKNHFLKEFFKEPIKVS